MILATAISWSSASPDPRQPRTSIVAVQRCVWMDDNDNDDDGDDDDDDVDEDDAAV